MTNRRTPLRAPQRLRIAVHAGLFPALIAASSLVAQETGAIRGTVVRKRDQVPLPGVMISLPGTGLTAVSDQRGYYLLQKVPSGVHQIHLRHIGYRALDLELVVPAGGTRSVDVAMEETPLLLGDIEVTAATLSPEPLATAPAAVSVVDSASIRDLSITGQPAAVLAALPGVDVVQSGMNDFNVNARGFNSPLNRRVLVLMDGRDLSEGFSGSQEWAALPVPLEDVSRIEVVRGPGSALYGANAYSGVVNITTPSARDVLGTKLTLAGGEVGSFQGDLRRAGVFGRQRLGYRLNLGYRRSDTWSRSRTDLGDLQREYAQAVDTARSPLVAPPPGFELQPLNGQRTPRSPGPSSGERDPLATLYGTARLELYGAAGTVLTAEAGDARTDNETYVTGAGRGQNLRASRPWARIAWAGSHLQVTAWYAGRLQPVAVSLSSGLPVHQVSSEFQGEVQYRGIIRGHDRVVLGSSIRRTYLNSAMTLLAPSEDARIDWLYSAYGHIEFPLVPRLGLVAAARFDDGDLFRAQVSPKVALVLRPNDRSSIHLSFNRAFQTPTAVEYFLSLPAGAPADFSALEAGLRASPLGPALANVPSGELFTQSAAVPVLALGSPDLEVERVSSWELGYSGHLGERLFLALNAYHGKSSDFVTDLLPGANPAYAPWTAPSEVAAPERQALEAAVRDLLIQAGQPLAAAGLTRLPGGPTAIVLSFGNAGRATTDGVEVDVRASIGRILQLDGNYALFTFHVNQSSLIPGSTVLPNTPKHKANLSLSYVGSRAFDLGFIVQVVGPYEWASGVFNGTVPGRQTVDAILGYRVTRALRAHVAATDLLNQHRYQVFGGSVLGRRVLGGLTLTF